MKRGTVKRQAFTASDYRFFLVENIRRRNNAAKLRGAFCGNAVEIFGMGARNCIHELGGMAGAW